MIRVAAYQATPHPTFKRRREQILGALEQADQNQIDFLCLPEGFLTGYYAEKEGAAQNCFDVSDPPFQEWLTEIAHFNVTAIVGFNEKVNDHIFDSAAIIEKGHLLGVQRKHYLYHDYFTPSSDFSTFHSKGITFGVTICLDTNYFEPARILALKGATILFAPMCNKVPLDHPFVKRPPYYSHFIARTHENRCWLVGADWIWPNDGKMACPGHSVIYDPNGKEIIRSKLLNEQLLIADIPTKELFYNKGKRVWGSSALTQSLNNLSERF